MNLYPAVYIKDGRGVELTGGDISRVTVYDEEPIAAAVKWESKGAKYLHIIDLDGIAAGTPQNIDIIKQIIDSVRIPVQVRGGIRNLEIGQGILDLGAERIIIGTAAADNLELVGRAVERFGERLIIGIDIKGKMIAAEGTGEITGQAVVGFAQKLEDMGVKTIIYTDVTRVGTLKGSDIVGITEILTKVFMNIIVAGGISDITDLKRLNRLGASGAIIGKALYSDDIDLVEALKVL